MSTPAWLNKREQSAWRAYIALSTQLDALIEDQLKNDSGISSSDFKVLVSLSEAPNEKMRNFEIGSILRWEKSRLSHQLARMEARGLVKRDSCKSDMRGAYVSLTKKGHDAIEAAAPLHVVAVRRHFINLFKDNDELEHFAELANRIADYCAQQSDK